MLDLEQPVLQSPERTNLMADMPIAKQEYLKNSTVHELLKLSSSVVPGHRACQVDQIVCRQIVLMLVSIDNGADDAHELLSHTLFQLFDGTLSLSHLPAHRMLEPANDIDESLPIEDHIEHVVEQVERESLIDWTC